MSAGRFLLWLLALLLVVVSGLQVAYSAKENRDLHMSLEAAQRSQDEALAVQSRLLLERSALAAYQNVERTAQVKLDMQFPATVERVAK